MEDLSDTENKNCLEVTGTNCRLTDQKRSDSSDLIVIESLSGRAPLTSILAAAPQNHSKASSQKGTCQNYRSSREFIGPLDGLMQSLVGQKNLPSITMNPRDDY